MSDFIVTVEDFDDLSEEEQDSASDNGRGKENASYIRVKYQGKTILLESDAVEPEDTTFYRDYSWVAEWLSKSYKLGLKDSSVGGGYWIEFDLQKPFVSNLCWIYGVYEGNECDVGDDGRSISWRTGEGEFAKALASVYYDPKEGFDIEVIYGSDDVLDPTFMITHYINLNVPDDPKR